MELSIAGSRRSPPRFGKGEPPNHHGTSRLLPIRRQRAVEVEHTNPNHADVEICPHCGRTRAYAELTGDMVEKVHDPLGLELLFDGTIRGQEIRFEDDQPHPFDGVRLLANRYSIDRFVYDADREDRNTLRVGVLVIAPFPRR